VYETEEGLVIQLQPLTQEMLCQIAPWFPDC
jgi:hypothetical protein